MSYFPIFLRMSGRRALVVGGGAVAERKISSLLEAAADVTVVSPQVTAAIARWSEEKALDLCARRYQRGDLAGYEIAFAAADDGEINASVYEEGRERGVWVNAADDPAHCDFILPSVLRRGDLAVAVSSGGGSPALARALREDLELYLGHEYEELATLAAEARAEVRRRSLNVPFEIWRKALSGEVREWLVRGDTVEAKRCLLRELGVAS